MRNLYRSRRGSVAFATVVALVPLIGVVALGAEAGSWYVIKRQAQTAADAAAISGALKLACSRSATCHDTQTELYRGKQFAAQNAFCNPNDTSYPGARCTAVTGVTQTVGIAVNGDSVKATVSQIQPARLASFLGMSTVDIGATATAKIEILANPCVLSLQLPISFQGSTTVSAPGCGLASNSKEANAIDFTGNGLTVGAVKSISAQGGCKDTGGTQCDNAITSAPMVPDPLSQLATAMASLSTGNFTGSACGTTAQPTPYDAGHKCYNLAGNGAGKFNFGNSTYDLNGVYFFSGALNISGSSIIKMPCTPGPACGVTIVLLPGSTLTINGNPTIQLTASQTVSTAQVPAALATVVNLHLMDKLLIFDPEVTATNQSVKISGNSASYFNGITYAPNASVEFTGSNQTGGGATCVEVIAKGVTLSGNSTFDNSGCPESSKIESKIVKLVQ